MKHPVKHLRFPEAAVETVAKFRPVVGQMLGTDAMMDTPDIAFHIGDQGMDPGQDFHGLFSRTGHQPHMETAKSIQEDIASPAIGLDHCLGSQTRPDQGLNLCAAHRGHQAPPRAPGYLEELALGLDRRYRPVVAMQTRLS